MLTCTQVLQDQLREAQKANPSISPTPIPNFYQDILSSVTFQINSPSATVNFPTSNFSIGPTNTNGLCGSMSWSQPAPPSGSNLPPSAMQQLQQSRSLAVEAMLNQLYGPAYQIVKNAIMSTQPKAAGYELGHIVTQSPVMVWGGGTLQKPAPFLLAGSTLGSAAASYMGIMAPTLNYLQNYQDIANKTAKWVDQAKQNGWILAGALYYQIIQLNSKMSISEKNPPTFNVTPLGNLLNSTSGLFPPSTPYSANINNLLNGPQLYQIAADSLFISDAVKYGNNLTYGQISVDTNGGDVPWIVKLIFAPFIPIFSQFNDLSNAQTNNQNPVFMLASLGSDLVNAVMVIFIIVGVTAFAISIGLAAVPFVALGVAIINIVLPIIAIFTPVLLALLVAGLTMSLYLPIVPFIIFTFGAIGWVIAVIEAIIAAPLVALGIAHPEGQEILGKAEPAVILLVNVFLRPTLMIFGFLIGMMLSYVGIWILNAGFWSAYGNVQSEAKGFVVIFGIFAAMIIYALLVIQVVQKSFSLIYLIPDEVLKWIGGNIKGMGGEAEAEKAVAGGASTAAEKGGQAAGAGMKRGTKTIEGYKGEETESSVSTDSKGAGDGTTKLS